MSVERSVLEKLASNAFTDEERGYLVEMLLAKQAESECEKDEKKEHGAPPFEKKETKGDEKDEKKPFPFEKKEHQTVEEPTFDVNAVVKEASELSDDDLAAAINAAASGIPDAECDAIVKQAYDDVVGEITMRKQAAEWGFWAFQGFDYAAQQKLAAQQEKQAAAGLAQRAPNIAALLSGGK